MTLYTSRTVAAWLGVTERRVRQLRDEGVIEEKLPGLYDLQMTVARYITFLRKGSGKADLNDERALLMKAKREAVDMENALRRRTLHDSKEVEEGVKTMCLNIRSRFLTLPSKLAHELSEMGGDQGKIFDRLKEAIDEVLGELSSYAAAFAERSKGDEEESKSL